MCMLNIPNLKMEVYYLFFICKFTHTLKWVMNPQPCPPHFSFESGADAICGRTHWQYIIYWVCTNIFFFNKKSLVIKRNFQSNNGLLI